MKKFIEICESVLSEAGGNAITDVLESLDSYIGQVEEKRKALVKLKSLTYEMYKNGDDPEEISKAFENEVKQIRKAKTFNGDNVSTDLYVMAKDIKGP